VKWVSNIQYSPHEYLKKNKNGSSVKNGGGHVTGNGNGPKAAVYLHYPLPGFQHCISLLTLLWISSTCSFATYNYGRCFIDLFNDRLEQSVGCVFVCLWMSVIWAGHLAWWLTNPFSIVFVGEGYRSGQNVGQKENVIINYEYSWLKSGWCGVASAAALVSFVVICAKMDLEWPSGGLLAVMSHEWAQFDVCRRTKY